jgi:hypothetical protein
VFYDVPAVQWRFQVLPGKGWVFLGIRFSIEQSIQVLNLSSAVELASYHRSSLI